MGTHSPLLEAALSRRRFGLGDLRGSADLSRVGPAARKPVGTERRSGPPSVTSTGAFAVEPSIAQRTPPARKFGSNTGTIYDPFRRRTIWFESSLEEQTLTVLVASSSVSEVAEQQIVHYLDGVPVRRRYTFDAIVTWRSAVRSAIEIKYLSDVTPELEGLLRAVWLGCLDRRFDDIRIATEFDFDDVTLSNARKVIECASDHDAEALAIVRSVYPVPGTRIALGELADRTRLDERGYRAAVALLQSGEHALDPGIALDPEALTSIGPRGRT